MRLIRFIPILFIFLEACVDPLKVTLLPGTQKFVVDGLITNDPGPYEVKLSYSTSFDTSLKKAPVASGASVWIYDNDIPEKLSEVSPGVYQTSKTGMRGQVGHEYYVKIKTKFGRDYQSLPQELLPAGEIKNIAFRFVKDGIWATRPEQYYDGVYFDAIHILIRSTGVESQNNLFRWRWNTVYKAKTYPEYRYKLQDVVVDGVTRLRRLADPLPCSGYIAAGGKSIHKVAECTCCECWPYEFSSRAIVSKNRIVDGLEFKDVDIGVIPAESMQFYDKYYLNVEQLSLSEDVYNFWNLTEKQETGLGNIFQPNSIKIKGNIRSITDVEEEVLGIFGVSGITRKEIYISPDVVPYKLAPIDSMFEDCSISFFNDYNVKPSFW